jgi:hypothetical protein
MKKSLLLAAAIAALAVPSFAQQATSTTLSTQGQETGAGLGLGGLTPAAIGGIVAGTLILGVVIAGLGDDDGVILVSRYREGPRRQLRPFSFGGCCPCRLLPQAQG